MKQCDKFTGISEAYKSSSILKYISYGIHSILLDKTSVVYISKVTLIYKQESLRYQYNSN